MGEKGTRRTLNVLTYSRRNGDDDDIVRPDSAMPLAGVMGQITKRVLGLRDKFWKGRRTLIQKIDAKRSSRQVAVDPAGAENFGYVLGLILR